MRFRTGLLSVALAVLLSACGTFSTPVPNPGGPWYADPAGNDADNCLSPATACAMIQAAVDKAQPGGTVIAAAGTYDEHVLITKALVLQGAGKDDTIINANGSDRTVVVGAALVEISQLTLRNGSTDSVGGNLINSGGDLTLTDMRLELGSADAGGGLYNDGSLNMDAVEVVGNSAETGGGVFNAEGAAITGSNLLIQSNPVTQAGGGIFNEGEIVLSDSVINSNSAHGDGGGAFNQTGASFDVTMTTISENVASGGYSGGGVYNRGLLNLVDSEVLQNHSESSGGGVSNHGEVLLINTNFSDNSTDDAGGALYSTSDANGGIVLDIRDGQFNGNVAGEGGAIFNSGNAYIQDAAFDDNEAATGGAFFNSHRPLELVNVDITNNRATTTLSGAGGAGIHNVGPGSQILLTNSLLDGNQTGLPSKLIEGGGIYSRQGSVIVAGTTISNNVASDGGGIHIESGSLELHSSTVEANHAYMRGGGLSILPAYDCCSASLFLVRRSTITGNSTDGNGGGIYSRYANLTIDDTTISSNTAGSFGAGAHLERGDIYRTTFAGNVAVGSGGGLSLGVGDTVALTNVTLSGNQATTGSAVFSLNRDLKLRYSTLAANQASSGAALVISARVGSSANAQLVGSILADNNGPNCSGSLINSLAANLSDDGSCPFNQPSDQQNTNPNLGPLQSNGGMTDTHALASNSPALNTDVCHSGVNQDQREQPRPGGSNCDSGAYERQLELIFVPDGPLCDEGIFADASLRSISLRENQGLLVVLDVPKVEPETELPGRLGGMDYVCRTDPGFDGRLFCVGPELPQAGQAAFQLYQPGCTDPVFEEPITVPLRPTPTPTPTPRVTPTRDPSGGR